MPTLSSPGLGSGLDINGLVSKLMAVEQQPLIALQTKEASYQAKISALGSLTSALSALQTASEGFIPGTGVTASDKFTTTRASVGDSTLANAAATNVAAAGSYTLSEITLAAAQQVRKTGMTIPAAAGTLGITVGTGSTVTVNIGANATLANIRDAINSSSAGITAAIINDGSNDYLVLSSKTTGAANTISITGSAGFEGFNYSTGTANGWTPSVTAANASVKVNGIPVTSSTNSISTAIAGVTLNLTKATADSTTLNISKDYGSVTTALNNFIKAYNDATATVKKLGAYNSETKTASTLTGDGTLRSVQTQLRTALFGSTGSNSEGFRALSDIGVSLQLDGTLKLDSSKLTTAINSNFSQVASLVSDVGSRFKATISSLTGASGIVTNKIDGLNASIKDLDKRQEAIAFRLQKVESNYRRQFNALDVQLSNMQSLSSRLTSMLSSIPKASSGSS